MLGIGMRMGHVLQSSSMERTTSPASDWHQHACRTARRLNVAWWLQSFAPWVAALGLIAMGVLIWLRVAALAAWPAAVPSSCAWASAAVCVVTKHNRVNQVTTIRMERRMSVPLSLDAS